MTLIPVTVRSSSENGSAQLFKSGPALGADADGEHFVRIVLLFQDLLAVGAVQPLVGVLEQVAVAKPLPRRFHGSKLIARGYKNPVRRESDDASRTTRAGDRESDVADE